MLIDANIFLEVLLEQKKSENCREVLRKIQMGGKEALISTFTIDTVILAMNRHKTPSRKIKIFLSSLMNLKGLKIYSVSFKDRIMALDLMDKYNLDYEDSITLQSAFSNSCKEILSFDKHFDKIEKIARIEP